VENKTGEKQEDKVKEIIIRLVSEEGGIGIYLVQGLNTTFLGYVDEIMLSTEMAKLQKFVSIWRQNPLDSKLRDYLRQEIIERLTRILAYMM